MCRLIGNLSKLGASLTLAVAVLLVSSQEAQAQFPAFGGGGMAVGYPFFGYGYGFPGMGYGYGGLGYGYPIGGYGIGPYGVGGYGYGGMGFGMGYGPFGYGFGGYGYGYPDIYAQTSPLYNPLFGVGLTPLGAQSYMTETQLFGRRSAR
jgi:hypothetical protein